MAISNRIDILIKALKLNRNSFSKAIGLDNNVTIGRIINENRNPSFEILEKILQTFGSVSADWLLMGEGDIFKVVNLDHKSSNQHTQLPVVITLDKAGNDNIAFVDTKAAAGYPVKLVEPEFYRELPAFSLPGGEFRNGLFRCFEVSGDSMADTLYHGDWVICRYLDGGISDIREGYIHVVVTTDQVLVKRVLNRTAKSHKLILQSDNQAYGLYSVTDAEVRELWLVKSKLSFNLPNRNKDIVKTMHEIQVEMHDLKERIGDLEGKAKNKK